MKLNPKRAALAVVAVAAALVVGCGGDDSTSSSDAGNPEDAVQAFFDASKAEDAEAACATLTDDSQDLAAGQSDSCEKSFEKAVKSGQSNVPDSIEIGDVTTDGDTATVPVTADGQDTTFTVVQQDGTWKLDLTASAAPAETGDSSDGTTGG